MTERRSVYFRDGVSRVDFVLVQKREKSEALRLQNYRFIANLRKMGLLVEREKGVKYDDFIFIKLHTPDDVLKQIADIHGVALTFENDRTVPKYNNNWWIFKTAITRKINMQDPLFSRCSESVRGELNNTYTSSERIMLTYFILVRTEYGSLPDEYGLLNLLANKNFEDAYPLHDGKWQWDHFGPLNDRQILCKFWANWRYFYKDQPTHLIYKYYGSEIAFHYAWLGFYTVMLLPISILGLLVFIASFFRMFFDDMEKVRIDDICKGTMDLCPPCVNPACLPQKIHTFCKESIVTYLTDNDLSISFACLIAIWATAFLIIWQRIEYTLLYKWNLINVKPDIDELYNNFLKQWPEFKRRTKNYVRINQYTGISENYYPLKFQIRQYTISFIFCFVCILIFVATVMVIRGTVYFFRHTVYLSQTEIIRDHGEVAVKMYSGLATVTFIKLYTPVVTKISLFLTDKEVHRTRNSYLNSFIFKSFVMSFFNTYTTLLYYAFLKNMRYTHPGDHISYDSTFGMAADVCPPALGCTASLSIHIFFLMVKNYIMMIITKSGIVPMLWNYTKRVINMRTKKKKKKVQDWSKHHIPQWEVDYELIKPSKMFFLESFTSTVLEFGAVTLFVAALPLLPLLALINNIINLRLSSVTLTRRIRRNIPTRVNGLGAWNVVLHGLTRISFVISGCIIVFTSIFVHRITYIYEKGNYTGFTADTVSEFKIDDFNTQMRTNIQKYFPNLTSCYYPGLRKPYNDPRKYQLSDRYYQILAFELLCLVGFVNVAFILTHILTVIIPREPQVIRQCIQYEEHQMHMKNLKKTEEEVERQLSGEIL